MTIYGQIADSISDYSYLIEVKVQRRVIGMSNYIPLPIIGDYTLVVDTIFYYTPISIIDPVPLKGISYNELDLFKWNVCNRDYNTNVISSIDYCLLSIWKLDYTARNAVSPIIPFPDTTGFIQGTVKVEGVLWKNIPVHLYYKPFGILIRKTFSDENGGFIFAGLEVGVSDYYVTAHRDGFNALVFDNIQPVNADGEIPAPYIQPDPWTPPPYEGWTVAELTTELWLDSSSSSEFVLVNGTVSQWNDKSGNNRHGIQLESTRRPKYINGVVFDAYTQFIDLPNTYKPSKSVFVVFNRTTQNQFVLFGAKDVNYYFFCGGGDTNPIQGGFGTPTYRMDGSAKSWTNRNNVFVDTNNRTSMVEIVNAVSTPNDFTISNYSDSYPAYDFFGTVYEIVIIAGTPTTVNREKIEGYLAHKWGLQDNLPIGHPYKTVRP